MHNTCRKFFRIEIFSQSLHRNISKSMICKRRAEKIHLSAANKCIACFCRPQICCVEISILIQSLGMTDRDLRTTLFLDFKHHNTGQILSEINNHLFFRCNQKFLTFPIFRNFYRCILLPDQDFFGIRIFHCRYFRIICLCIVNYLTVINLTVSNCSCCTDPAFVRANPLFCSVLIKQIDLCDQRRSFTIMISLIKKSKNSLIPSVSYCKADFLFIRSLG